MEKPAILIAKEIYYPIIATMGIPANVMTIIILSQRNCGVSKCMSIYMVAMATADLLVMVIDVTLYRVLSFHFPFSFLSRTPVCRAILYTMIASFDLSVWFTVSFTFDRFAAICGQQFKQRFCTARNAGVVVTAFSFVSFLKNIPTLFAYETQQRINGVQWGCQSSADFFFSPPGIAFVWFHSAWVVWFPFTLILLFNSMTIRSILLANRIRKALRGHRNKNHSDPEIENRVKSIILLFSVSGCFIVFWLTASVSFVSTRVSNTTYYRGDYSDPGYIALEAGTFLKFLICLQNPCIYVVTQSKFRKALNKVICSLATNVKTTCEMGLKLK